MKHGVGSIILDTGKWIGISQKLDGITRKDDYVEIVKHLIKTSVGKIKLGLTAGQEVSMQTSNVVEDNKAGKVLA